MLSLKRTSGAWLLIIMAESVSGAFRRLVLAPRVGELAAHQLGVAVGCGIIFLVAWFFIGRVVSVSWRRDLLAGLVWVALTVAFEVTLGLLMGFSAGRILADYDLPRGGLMGLGLLFMLFAPLMAARLRRTLRQGGGGFDQR
jgi:hypothetical protein